MEQAGTCLIHGPGWPLLHGQRFLITHREMPLVAAEVPGIPQDVLAGLTAPLDSALPVPSVFSAGSAPSKPESQLFIFSRKDFLGAVRE